MFPGRAAAGFVGLLSLFNMLGRHDLFGTIQVGAIHGRLLTAWSAAGVAGPVLVNYIRQYQIDNGVAKADAYTVTMYIMAGLLLVGLVCNLLVRPLPGLVPTTLESAPPRTSP